MFRAGDRLVPVETYFSLTDVFSAGKVFEILEVHHGLYETVCGRIIMFGDESLFVPEAVYKSKLYRALK